MAQHGLGDFEVGDDAVLHGADGHDVAGRAAQHLLGLGAHGQHNLAAARIALDRHHGRFGKHHARALHVHERVRRAQVDGQVRGEIFKEFVKQLDHKTPGS